MFFKQVKFLNCLILLVLFTLTLSKPSPDLRRKLERLLQDSEYDELENEVIRPRQIQGMLLKDLREHKLFDSSSEEKFYTLLNRLEKNSNDSISEEEYLTSSTTESPTTTITSTEASLGSADTDSSTSRPSIYGSIERLSSIITRLIQYWRKS